MKRRISNINPGNPPSRGASSASLPVLEGFHPAVKTWFVRSFGAPTAVQARGWEAIRTGRHALIAAPTGSGKTLSAFLDAIDGLFREGLAGELPDETRVVYVSPLKALSADIHHNLAEPRRAIHDVAREMGIEAPRITAAVRSSDTPSAERQSMLTKPPHILVTTPESLYILLTAEKSRRMLSTVRTVIVDEIHAVVESRRGSHLALSLERLQHVVGSPLQRIGLSATQKPIVDVARFLVGSRSSEDGTPDCIIIDEGHVRALDLALEVPQSPLEAVLSGEVREEVYDRVAALVREHRTTLVFVNTRREAERGVHRLAERLGEEAIAAHHGSLSKEARLDAERRLKEGSLKALVATASLELGIDIGHIDLVCQLGSPRRIAILLQRVGRSGHTVHGMPKGRLFPLTRDELVESAALIRAVRCGELDRVEILEAPVDILAQQIIAESACEDWDEEALFELVRRAHPYRALTRASFDEIVRMVSEGFATGNGRRGARVHYDAVNHRLRGRRGARLAAITSGGAIPDNADYRVVLEPENTFVGTVDEDFAVESMPGDVFQLGSTSWRVLRVELGVVRVADAHGEPTSIPFWFGEAPARSPELSAAIADLRREVELRLEGGRDESAAATPIRSDSVAIGGDGLGPSGGGLSDEENQPTDPGRNPAIRWLTEEVALPSSAAFQIVEYLAESRRLLSAIPTQDTLVLERFFDEAGGMQLILHAPFGSRVNRAWGLALRKRFCRQFNFELQAAATEEGILLSLGPQHSFPLEDVFRYLHPASVEDVLIQALLDAPMFQTRWRWSASLSLALLRWRGGRKVAPQVQRMEAEDLLVSVFPDAAACLENIEGEREVSDHPLVRQTVQDCLNEVMDLPRLKRILERIHRGDVRLVARDTPEPSPLSHELLTARPYAFLDDAPLEERRANAVRARRALEPSAADAFGRLDDDAIRRVREEARPVITDPDELHDSLLTYGFLIDIEGRELGAEGFLDELIRSGRAVQVHASTVGGDEAGRREVGNGSSGVQASTVFWIAVERLEQARLVWPAAEIHPPASPVSRFGIPEGRTEAWGELLRARMSLIGPTTAAALSRASQVPQREVDQALLGLEAQGVVLRGRFTPGVEEEEWCDRRLLARIHRYTIDRLRSEIEPVSPADFMRFLIRWQHAEPDHRVSGPEGLMAVLEQLEGIELPGVAWETEVLPARCVDYSPEDLDVLCASGRVMWGRLSAPAGEGQGLRTTGPLRSSPIAIWRRESASMWLPDPPDVEALDMSTYARGVYDALAERGASFLQDLVGASRLLPTQVERGLGELVAFGLVTSDSFSGLRALLTPVDQRNVPSRRKRRGKTAPYGVHSAGRWSLLSPPARHGPNDLSTGDGSHSAPGVPSVRPREAADVEVWARLLLRRYGVVFRRLLARETHAPAWRDLLRAFWRLEARGEVRGGRFITGFSGEQFALADAVGLLRKIRKEAPSGQLVALSAADPLNLTGIVLPGSRLPSVASNRIGFRGGVPVVVFEGGQVRGLENGDAVPLDVVRAIRRRAVPPELHILVR